MRTIVDKNDRLNLKIKIFAILSLMFLASCAGKIDRQLSYEYYGLEQMVNETGPTIGIGNMSYVINSSKIDGFEQLFPNPVELFQDCFSAHLCSKGLIPKINGNGNYNLEGNFVVIEKGSVNGYIVPAFILACLPPIGTLIAIALPYYSVTDEVTANVSLFETSDGREILEKEFTHSNNFLLSGYQTARGKRETAKINTEFKEAALHVIKEISDEVSRAIIRNEDSRESASFSQ